MGEVRFDQLSPATGQGFDKLGGSHIYMGARRPLEFEPADNQRTDSADWAIAQLGKPYAIIGGGAFLAAETPLVYEGFTCVGFTELAYEFGGNKAIVPQAARTGIFTPSRQFQWTRPVDTAEIEADEEFFCWIVGVVNQGTPISNDDYTQHELYTVAVDLAACNDNARAVLHTNVRRARFEPEPSGAFSFLPNASDAGKEFKFAFVVDATKSNAGIERTAMTIKVTALPTRYRRMDPGYVPFGGPGRGRTRNRNGDLGLPADRPLKRHHANLSSGGSTGRSRKSCGK